VLLVASALHVCNDAFFAVLYPVLPFIAAELGLSYSQVGLIKTVFSGSSAVLQLPAGLLAEAWGEYTLLAWGNAWVAAGLIGMAATSGLGLLLLASLLGGLGGNVQHPLASAMVARAYEGGRRAAAIGTLNFAGDLGKVAAPALVTLTAVSLGWRTTLVLLGVFGLVFSVAVGLARHWVDPPRLTPPSDATMAGTGAGNAGARHGSYRLLTVIGMLDATGRAAGLTFLPFGLAARGLNAGEISLVLGLVFAGGALGKFVCGFLGERLGPFAIVVATEFAAAAALLGLLVSPVGLVLGLAVVFGFGLNGTSSVLYAAVAGMVPEGKRGRGYGLYYTGTESAAAVAPLVYGVLADRIGLAPIFVIMAALTIAVIPLTSPLRRELRV
jgi:MFS transporter, FSR family, fosmidomycin resistance protein